jgi:hypothetical protein
VEVDYGRRYISVIIPESMLLALDLFTWQRPVFRKKGFQWEETDGDLRLVPVPGAALQAYQPHPGIFRDFADLEPTPEAVLNFANRYGTLQNRLEWNSFAFWRQGIQHFNQLVTLSDAVTGADREKISKALEPFLSNPSLASAGHIRPILQKQKRGENICPNKFVHAAVLCLIHAISPAERFNVQGSWSFGKVVVQFKHANLLGYMFHQLGLALIGGRQFRRCEGCGKWSLTSGVNRSNRTTCSDYCRLRLHRQRKKAREMHRQGCSARKIANEIREEVSKVKKWLFRPTRPKTTTSRKGTSRKV